MAVPARPGISLLGVGIAAGLALASPRLARADEQPAHARVLLEYAVEHECPDRESFAAAIATRLGYDAVVDREHATPETKTLRVDIHRDRGSLRAAMKLVDPNSTATPEKTLVAKSGACAELVNASAFASAIVIDPRAMFPKPASKSEPAAAQTPPEPPKPPTPGEWPWYEPPPGITVVDHATPPPSRSDTGTATIFHFGAGIGSCAGCGPELGLAGHVFAGIAKERFGFDLGARADLPAHTRTASGANLSSSILAGEVFPHARLGFLRLGVVGHVGALFGEALGSTQTSPWIAAGPRIGGQWSVAESFFLYGNVQAELVIARVSLRAEGSEVWKTPVAIVASNVGVGLSFQ